jgi:hypothetical protein
MPSKPLSLHYYSYPLNSITCYTIYIYMLPPPKPVELVSSSSSSSSSSMGDQQVNSRRAIGAWQENSWVVMEGGEDICDSISIGSSTNSRNSAASSSSSELVEDATSSTSTCSSSSSSGPLYELSELLIHLPMK